MLLNKKFILFLFVVICHNHLEANPEVQQRFEKVIAHIEKHPIKELPIGRHPVYPERVFCRLFNISLSARAYFQLNTDPSMDASSSQMLEKVGQWYLDTPEKMRDPDSAYWAGEYHSAALAKFGTNGSVRKAAISRKSELVILEYMLSYVNYWSRLGHYEESLKHQTFHYWASENHWWQEIVTSWGYLMALKEDPVFKDRILNDGKSIQEHYERTCAYMKQHMQQRARKGFLIEISSGGYSTRMHNMWYAIYDLSPDKKMRDLARNTLDLWWTFWAEEQISGERGGGKVRHRRMRGLAPNTEGHMIPGWLFFGTGSLDFDHIKTIKSDRTTLAVHYMLLFSGYRPDEVIYKIMEDRKSAPPFAIRQRRLGKSELDSLEFPEFMKVKTQRFNIERGDCFKYSWVTPDFVLGTVMRPPHNVSVWNPGSAQGWWHGLLISGEGPNEPPERVVPTLINRGSIEKGDFFGDQYALQSKGSFMTRRIPDKFWGTDNTQMPMGIFISTGLRGYIKNSGNFLFINSPGCWVAVRAVATDFVISNQVLVKKHQGKGDFYKMENENQPLIIEVAHSSSYKSFEEFRAAVVKAKLVSGNGEHSYDSLSGDRLTMYDDRSTPNINNKEIEYNPRMAYDSRYVKSEWNSGIVTISAGGIEKVLDFTREK